MSEATKPVEEPVVAPTSTEVPAVEPKTEETPAAEPVVAADVPAGEEVAAEPAKEVTPFEEGVLGYKGPGLLKSFIFQKKFFWFGTDAIESKSLTSYLRGEKPEVGNNNVAWAASTGKGLFLFSKKEAEKGSPAGIINLSDASEVSPDGTIDFFFTIGGHKHTFQAANLADRDNWVAVLTTKITEAKEIAESVKASEAYTSTHTTLSKPTVAPAPIAAVKKSVEVKKEEKAEDKEEKKEEAAEAKEEKKEEKKTRKDRSQSRKRTSIFGAIPGFGKKEEKVEAAKDEAAVTPAVDAPVTEAPVEAAAPVEETLAVAPVTEEVAAPTPAVEEPVVAAPVTEKPAPTKRASIFGTLQSKFSHKKADTEAPAVPAKDEEPVSETAPVIPAPETSEPLAAEETPAAVETPEVKTETPAVKSEKRKSSLPFLSKKEKAATSDEEGEKPLSPFAKLRATVRGKKAEKAVPEKAEDKVEESAEESKAEETPAAEPVVTEPVAVAPAPTAQVSATA